MNITFHEFTEEFLDISWKWTNDPDIRRLIMAPKITKSEQYKWFLSLSQRKDYVVFGICANNVPIGVVGLKKIDLKSKRGEYFGYIGEKEYWGCGIGSRMMEYIEEQALKRGLTTLYLYVSIGNTRAIHLYEKNRYKKKCTITIDNDNNCHVYLYEKDMYLNDLNN